MLEILVVFIGSVGVCLTGEDVCLLVKVHVLLSPCEPIIAGGDQRVRVSV